MTAKQTQTTFLNTSLKSKLSHWQEMFNRVKSAHSFGKIKTWRDYLLNLGLDEGEMVYAYSIEQLNSPITFQQVKFNLECIKTKIEMGEWSTGNLEVTINTQPIAHEYPEGIFYDPTKRNSNVEDQDKQSGIYNRATSIREEMVRDATSFVLPPSEKQSCTLFHFQERAAAELLDGIVTQDKKGQLLIAGAGLGKTFIIGALIRRILDMGFLKDKTLSPWPIILVTRAPIVIQCIRVLEERFNICCIKEVTVINIEQLRSRFGELFVREQTRIVKGEPEIDFVWHPLIFPSLLLLDECQSVMRPESMQSRILQKYNDIPNPNKWQIYFSATPFTKVSQAKCFTVASGIKSRYAGSLLGGQSKVTNDNWHTFASNVAAPSDPEEHNEAAVERLMKELLSHVVDVKGVRSQFRAINRVEMIPFESEEDRIFYLDSWNRFQRDKARIESEAAISGGSSQMAVLAAYTKFRQAAEYCRRRILARRAVHRLKEGFAPVIACCFKTTITAVVKILVTEYKIPRSKISLIWGGKNESKSKALKKKELREKLSQHKDFLLELQKMGTSLKELGLNANDVAELMDEEAEKLNKELANSDLRLGNQTRTERQSEIDKFQSGQTDICIFTDRAGGVGLSLHHCDDLTERKVKRKKDSNWAVVEDIPNIPIKPRILDATPVYSAISLVQVLGRCARLTSLSDTLQTMLFFEDSIEVDVAHSVSQKLRCLKKVVRQKDQMHWEDVIIKADSCRPHHTIDTISDWEDIKSEDGDDSLLGGGGEDSEDEEED